MVTFRCLLFSICLFFFKGFFLAHCGCVLVPAHDRSGFAVLTHIILHFPKSKLWPELSYKDEFLIDFRISLSLGAQYWERKSSSTPPLFQQHFFTLSSDLHVSRVAGWTWIIAQDQTVVCISYLARARHYIYIVYHTAFVVFMLQTLSRLW